MTPLGVSGDGFQTRLNTGNSPLLKAEELSHPLGWGLGGENVEEEEAQQCSIYVSLLPGHGDEDSHDGLRLLRP